MVENEVEFFADPIAGGRITPRAMAEPEGTISLPFVPELIQSRQTIVIARLAGFGWYFNIGYHDGTLVVQRNGGQIKLGPAWFHGKKLPGCALASWKEDALIVSFGTPTTHWNYPQCSEKCQLVRPPSELLKWIESKELTPSIAFATEQEFCIRVHSSLQRFDERLRPVVNSDVFWDFVREGNRIMSRKPKREIEIQSVIHMTLVDHMRLSNIAVIPEARSGAGALDFLFTGVDTAHNQLRFCAEFKYAHSADLTKGLSEQLRAYMRSLGVENGAYCVFDFRGPHFKRPSKTTRTILDSLYEEDRPFIKQGLKPIKVHWWALCPDRK